MSSDRPKHSFDSHVVQVLSKRVQLPQRLPGGCVGAEGEQRPWKLSRCPGCRGCCCKTVCRGLPCSCNLWHHLPADVVSGGQWRLPAPAAKLLGTDLFIPSKLLNLFKQNTTVQWVDTHTAANTLVLACTGVHGCPKPGLATAGSSRVAVGWEKEGDHWVRTGQANSGSCVSW